MLGRREFLLGALPAAAAAAANAQQVAYPQQFPDMLAAYLAARLNRLAQQWDEKRAAISTPEAMSERNRWVRAKVVEMVGGFPARAPLEPRVIKVMERRGYRVENVMFQSRPNFWVTANLYVPAAGGSARKPAIISPCGHYPLARMLPQYQIAYQLLAKSGFVVLAFDPIGQGERRQYWNPDTGATEVGSATTEHSMAGQLQLLFGDTLTGYRMWDAMRAIDYLESRPEVDTSRIGCTGHSGGGTLTMFTAAVDERIGCAVIHEGGTRARWPLKLAPFAPVGPSDVEQNLFPAATHGIDNPDLHIAVAPRPLMATIEHLTPEFEATAQQIRARYRLLGVEEKFAAIEAGDPHAWTHKLRIATADWFGRWFLGHAPQPVPQSELIPERPEDLRCTPNGSIRYSGTGETVWTTLWRKPAPAPVASAQAVRAELKQLLRLETHNGSTEPQLVQSVVREGYTIDKLAFLSEPGIYVPTWVFQPLKRRAGTPPILYFNESGMESDGMEFDGAEAAGLHYGVLASLAKDGYQVIAADVRGVGQTRTPHRPNSGGSPFSHLFDSDTAFAYMAWFMDSSLLGMRVADVMRTVDYALSRSDHSSGQRVWAIGKDMAALLVLFAAALDQRIDAAVCHRGLLSYRALTAGADRYLHGANVLMPRALLRMDLPDAAAAARRVALLSPVDAMKRTVDLEIARQTWRGSIPIATAAANGPALARQYVELLSAQA